MRRGAAPDRPEVRPPGLGHVPCRLDLVDADLVVGEADVDEDMQCTCCLEDQEIRELVKVGKAIEAHYGGVMDIEWAIDQDFSFPENIFIVQARPETVWSRRQQQSKIGKKTGRQLLMEQAMKRIKLPG